LGFTLSDSLLLASVVMQQVNEFCLSHTSKLIRYVADHHCIRFGLNSSPFGRNISFCARRYSFDVDVFFNKFSYFRDVIYSCVSSKFTSAPNCTADLLFECTLIRDGRVVLPPWFLSSDVSDIISCLCTDL